MSPHDLISKHADGILTADEAATLAAAMAADPSLANAFAAATRMDAALGEILRECSRSALYTRRMERADRSIRPKETPAARRLPRVAIAAGIAAGIGLGAWILYPRDAGPALQLAGKQTHSTDRTAPDSTADSGFPDQVRALGGQSARLRRELRRFQTANSNLAKVPLSQALAALESEWKDHAVRGMAAVPIQLSDSVKKGYERQGAEPVVSLEIPGISLLTNLNLLAAQAGLKVAITDKAVTLEPDSRADDGSERTWTLPLDQPTLAAFVNTAAARASLASWMPNIRPIVLTENIILQPNQDSPQSEYSTYDWSRMIPPAETSPFTTTWKEAPLVVEASVPEDRDPFLDGLPEGTTQFPVTPDAAADTNGEFAPPGIPQNFASIDAAVQNAVERNLAAQFPPSTWQLLTATDQVVNASTSEDGYTIDLNLAPEVIDFEGFINYGEPIQTSGSPSPDPQTTLTNLLAGHGGPPAAAFDAASAHVTATGTLTQLRAASAAVEALRESAMAGFTVRAKVVNWPESHSLDQSNSEPRVVSEREWQQEVKLAGAAIASSLSKQIRPLNGKDAATAIGFMRDGDKNAVESVTISGCRTMDGIDVIANCGVRLGAIAQDSIPLKVDSDYWVRWDAPASGASPARSLFLSIRPASVPVE